MSKQDPLRYKYVNDPDILHYSSSVAETYISFITQPQSFFHIYNLKTKIESGLRPAPTLKWEYEYSYGNEHLNIKACVEYKSSETEWCHAPFMNTSTGSVCLGTSDLKTEDLFTDINALKETIIKGFFASAFTHAGTQKCTKSNFIKLQQDLLNAKEFPTSQLIPINAKTKKGNS